VAGARRGFRWPATLPSREPGDPVVSTRPSGTAGGRSRERPSGPHHAPPSRARRLRRSRRHG